MPNINLSDLGRYPQLQLVREFTVADAALIGCDDLVDAQSNRFEATGYLFQNTTRILVRKLSPQGVELAGWVFAPVDPGKLDAISMIASGSDVIVGAVTHDHHPINPRDSWREVGRIPGVFAAGNTGGKTGPAGAYVPSESEPNPEPGGDVDYDRIQRMVDAGFAELVNKFGGSSVRNGIEQKVQDGMNKLFGPKDPNNPRIEEFQTRYFEYVKNAAANPIKNVLGADDDWGELRRNELKAIIREVLEEPLHP